MSGGAVCDVKNFQYFRRCKTIHVVYDNNNVLFPKMYREKFSGYVKQQGLVLF